MSKVKIKKTSDGNLDILTSELGGGVLINGEQVMCASQVSNPNLLINGDFKINQRGFTSVSTGNVYTVDRWEASLSTTATGTLVTLNDDGTISLSNSSSTNHYFIQRINPKEMGLYGKQTTATLTFADGTKINIIWKFPDTFTSAGGLGTSSVYEGIDIRGYMYSETQFGVTLDILPGSDATVKSVKLELGNISTAFVPRLYAEELALCKRYFQRITYNCIPTMYTSAASSLYCMPLEVALRTNPTIESVETANVRDSYAGKTLTTATLTATSYAAGGIWQPYIRFSATHDSEITAQATNLFIQEVLLDAEIY